MVQSIPIYNRKGRGPDGYRGRIPQLPHSLKRGFFYAL